MDSIKACFSSVGESLHSCVSATPGMLRSAGSSIYSASSWTVDVVSSGAKTAGDGICTAAQFVGSTASTAWTEYLSPALQKIVAVAKESFEAIKAWVQNNPEAARGGAIGCAIGAGTALLVSLICCRPNSASAEEHPHRRELRHENA